MLIDNIIVVISLYMVYLLIQDIIIRSWNNTKNLREIKNIQREIETRHSKSIAELRDLMNRRSDKK